jgi:hypothetical protein
MLMILLLFILCTTILVGPAVSSESTEQRCTQRYNKNITNKDQLQQHLAKWPIQTIDTKSRLLQLYRKKYPNPLDWFMVQRLSR